MFYLISNISLMSECEKNLNVLNVTMLLLHFPLFDSLKNLEILWNLKLHMNHTKRTDTKLKNIFNIDETSYLNISLYEIYKNK